MKTQKREKKSKKPQSKKLALLSSSHGMTTPITIHSEYPPPQILLEEAMDEPDRKLLDDYSSVIALLRNEKHFTFREIAEWLQQRGVEVDHNAIYRQYTKGMSIEEERNEEMRDALEQQDER